MLFCLNISKTISLEEAWDLIENEGISVLYGTEEDSEIQLFIDLESEKDVPTSNWIMSSHPFNLPSIDWEAQWATHGVDFHDGHVHVSLAQYKKGWKELILEPGPGFGNLSHPTTCLVLDLMAHEVDHQPVIDIGCGSGILSLAACAMGSTAVWGIDIDKEALTHSEKNAQINHFADRCHFLFPENFFSLFNGEAVLIVMNMISSEQQVAWQSLPNLHDCKGKILISGIRVEDHQSYLKLTKTWGWRLEKTVEKEGWLGFVFQC